MEDAREMNRKQIQQRRGAHGNQPNRGGRGGSNMRGGSRGGRGGYHRDGNREHTRQPFVKKTLPDDSR